MENPNISKRICLYSLLLIEIGLLNFNEYYPENFVHKLLVHPEYQVTLLSINFPAPETKQGFLNIGIQVVVQYSTSYLELMGRWATKCINQLIRNEFIPYQCFKN